MSDGMARARILSVYLAATLFGFTTFAAQTLALRRFLWRCEATEAGVALFFCCWLLWSGIGAAIAATRRGQRIAANLARFEWLPVTLCTLLYIAYYALIGNMRAWLGIPAYHSFPLLMLALGCLLANAPFCLIVGWGMPLLSHAFRRLDQAVNRAFACEALGAALCGLLLTLALHHGFTPDPRDVDEWRRVFPAATQKPARFETGGGTTLIGMHGNTFYAITAGGGYDVIPEGDHAMERAALALSQRPYATNILIVGEVPLATAQALKQIRPDIAITYAPPDAQYGAKLLQALDATPLRIEAQAAGDTPMRFIASLPDQTFELVLLMPPAATSLAGVAWRDENFLREIRRITRRNGALLYSLSLSGDALAPEKSRLLEATVRTIRAVWPEGGVLAAGAGGWWIATKIPTLAYSADAAAQRLAMLKKELIYPANAVKLLYDEARAGRLAQECPALRPESEPLPPYNTTQDEFLTIGVAEALRHNYPTATPGIWMARLQELPLVRVTALLLILLWILPVALSSHAAAGRNTLAAWLGACGALGLATSLAVFFQLQARFGALYLLAGAGSALYLGGLFLGNLGGGKLIKHLRTEALLQKTLLLLVPLLQVGVALILFNLAAKLSNAIAMILFCLAGGFVAGFALPVALSFDRESQARNAAIFVLTDALGASLAGLALIILPPLTGLPIAIICLATLTLGMGVFALIAVEGAAHFAAAVAVALTLVLLGRSINQEDSSTILQEAVSAVPQTLPREAPDAKTLHGVPRRVDQRKIEAQLRTGALATNEAAFWE